MLITKDSTLLEIVVWNYVQAFVIHFHWGTFLFVNAGDVYIVRLAVNGDDMTMIDHFFTNPQVHLSRGKNCDKESGLSPSPPPPALSVSVLWNHFDFRLWFMIIIK